MGIQYSMMVDENGVGEEIFLVWLRRWYGVTDRCNGMLCYVIVIKRGF